MCLYLVLGLSEILMEGIGGGGTGILIGGGGGGKGLFCMIERVEKGFRYASVIVMFSKVKKEAFFITVHRVLEFLVCLIICNFCPIYSESLL